MTAYLFSLSLLICAVLLIRAAFRKTVSPRVIYALWLVIVLRMVLPVTLFSVETELPAFLRERFVLTETEGGSAKTEASSAEVSAAEVSVPPTPKEPTAMQTPVPTAPAVLTGSGTEAMDFPGQKAQASGQAEKTPAFAPEEAPKGQRDDVPAGYPEETAVVSWRRIAGIVWISGSLLLAAWFAFTDITFQCRLRKERRPHRKIQGIRVYISGNAGVPCVAGWLPAIYLTPEAADSPAEPLILLHEYTHLRHGDPVWSVFRALALILFWWNPLVWAAAVCSGRDAELACDDGVCAQLDDAQRLKYANTLLDTVPQKKSFAPGFGSAPLRERILRLTKKRKNHVICVLLAVLLSVSAAGCSFIQVKALTAEENPVSEENPTPDTELSDTADDAIHAEMQDETPSAFCGPYFGYVKDAETDWIDLYPEKDGTPAARIPYEIFCDWAGMNRTAEGWTPGWMDGIAFYYAAFGDTRWAAAHLQETVLSVGRKLTALSRDGGETWTYDMTTDCGGNHVTCIGFADENTAFMGFDPIREFDWIPDTPAVSRTADGGKTWERIGIPVPDYSEKKLFLPVSFRFDGAEGKLLLDVLDWDTRIFSERIAAVTHDGGMTWESRRDFVTVSDEEARIDSFDPEAFTEQPGMPLGRAENVQKEPYNDFSYVRGEWYTRAGGKEYLLPGTETACVTSDGGCFADRNGKVLYYTAEDGKLDTIYSSDADEPMFGMFTYTGNAVYFAEYGQSVMNFSAQGMGTLYRYDRETGAVSAVTGFDMLAGNGSVLAVMRRYYDAEGLRRAELLYAAENTDGVVPVPQNGFAWYNFSDNVRVDEDGCICFWASEGALPAGGIPAAPPVYDDSFRFNPRTGETVRSSSGNTKSDIGDFRAAELSVNGKISSVKELSSFRAVVDSVDENHHSLIVTQTSDSLLSQKGTRFDLPVSDETILLAADGTEISAADFEKSDQISVMIDGRIAETDPASPERVFAIILLGQTAQEYADTPEALSSLGLPVSDPRLAYIRAFVSGDTEALEELCCVEKGVYESYGTIQLSAWRASIEMDDQYRINLYFSFFPTASEVNAFPAGQWNTYILSESVGVLLSDADGTGDTDRDVSGEAAETVGSFLRGTLIRELPDAVDKESPESLFLTCYICGRLHLGNQEITEASVKAYAKDCFGIEDFQPDENHLEYGCAHGGAWQALTVTDVRDNADGTVSVTVQYYADRAKTVCSHIVMYTVEKIGTEWAFLEHEVIFRAPFEPFGYSM